MPKWLGNVFGAFSDGAILFPMLAVLSVENGFSGVMLLAFTGLVYVISGFIFKVPMAVQPLKAIVAGAIAIGASAFEIRMAGAAIGFICLLLTLLPFNRLAEKFPRPLIHGVQLGLGVILILKGIHIFQSSMMGTSWFFVFGFFTLIFLIVILSERTRFPFLGIVATGGLLYSIFIPNIPPLELSVAVPTSAFRMGIPIGLVLSQLVLTLANSVIATDDVAHRYFGNQAKRVSPKGLLYSLGFGNVLSAMVGGLPFCHGSGGLTAHVRGGSTHWSSNLVIGVTLIGFAVFSLLKGRIPIFYPPLLCSMLLLSVGIFHLKLAAPSWATPRERFKLMVMAVLACGSQNLFWVLCAGVLVQIVEVAYRKVFMERKTA